VVLSPKETYLLAFVDRNERVRLRTSADGLTWSDDTPPQLSLGDNGAGVSASQDVVGAIRHLAYPNVAGRLQVRVGLGNGNWDSGDVDLNVRPSGRPTEVPIDANHSLFASLSGGRAVFHKVDVKRRTVTDVTPTGVGTILNSNLRRTPAIARMRNRIVVAWQRFSSNEPSGQPREIQIVAGDVSAAGAITWTHAYTFPTNAYGNAISQPTLTHNHESFLLGLVRTPKGRVFIVHSSRDGVLWTEEQNFIVGPPGDPIDTTAELAARSDGTMVAAFVGPSTRQAFRYAGGQWNPLEAGSVFGSSQPHARPFGLVSVGGPEVRTVRTNLSNMAAGIASSPSFASVGGRDGRMYVSYLTNTDKIMFAAGSMASLGFGPPIELGAVGFAFAAPIGADGDSVHVVWQDGGVQNRVLRLRSSVDGGRTFANPLDVSTGGQNSKRPAIAVRGSVVHVVWAEGGTPPAGTVRYRRSVAGGATLEAEIELDPNAGSSSTPQVAANGSNVYVFWCGGGSARLARSTDDGATFSPFVTLGAAASICVEQLAVDGSRVFAGWRHSSTGSRPWDIMMNRSLDGGATWGVALNMTGLPTDSGGLRLAAKDGVAYMVWHEELQSSMEIFVRHSTDGNTFSTPQQLSNLDGEDSSFPDISVDGGHAHVTWQDAGTGNFDVAYAHKGPGTTSFDPWMFLPPIERSMLGEIGPRVQNRGADLHVIYEIRDSVRMHGDLLYYGRRGP
jgi:hypothetical protein